MPVKTLLSALAGLVFVWAFVPYIFAIVRGKAKPKKVTWLIWASGDIIILAGMIAKGTLSGQLIGAVLGATITLLLSLRFGEAGWTTGDKVCLSLAGLAIALWIYFGDSNVGIALSLLALVIAAWPTYVSAWENEANEDKQAWIWFNISSVLALLAIPTERTFANSAPAITFMVIDGVMIHLLFIRPKWVEVKGRVLGW